MRSWVSHLGCLGGWVDLWCSSSVKGSSGDASEGSFWVASAFMSVVPVSMALPKRERRCVEVMEDGRKL